MTTEFFIFSGHGVEYWEKRDPENKNQKKEMQKPQLMMTDDGEKVDVFSALIHRIGRIANDARDSGQAFPTIVNLQFLTRPATVNFQRNRYSMGIAIYFIIQFTLFEADLLDQLSSYNTSFLKI